MPGFWPGILFAAVSVYQVVMPPSIWNVWPV
jgi:hypothetical protein